MEFIQNFKNRIAIMYFLSGAIVFVLVHLGKSVKPKIWNFIQKLKKTNCYCRKCPVTGLIYYFKY